LNQVKENDCFEVNPTANRQLPAAIYFQQKSHSSNPSHIEFMEGIAKIKRG